MTVHNESGIAWIAVCEGCGEELLLDTDHTGDETDAIADMEEKGWTHFAPEKRRFKDGLGSYTETYQQDLCDGCAEAVPGPKPVTRPVPPRLPPRGAFDNDPCDTWPKLAIFAALDLATCGHSRGPLPCVHCQREAETGQTIFA